ncbi:MAG TPA: glycosyltransferase family 2 protein [Tepidisphaeraceae bacterium]|jgi:glycosyltransferase involved in cell wall biosynthesis
MSKSRVSVLMPVYNAAAFVQQAVESILAQTYRDFEFIIVDDGSTDRTSRILKKLASRDPRIHLIHQSNAGIVAALNNGLQHCAGDLIARMDADDVSMPQRFERQVEYLDAHPECVCVGSRVLAIDPYGGVLYTSEHEQSHEWIDRELLKGVGWAVVHPVAMLRKGAMSAVGAYRREFQWAEDMDLFLRLAELGKLANLPDILLQYRQHPDSVNRSRQKEQIQVINAVVADAHRRRGLTMDKSWSYIPMPLLPKHKQLLEWAWKALKEGKISAARKCALDVWKTSPLNIESWRILYCAMRGH